jgi:acetyl esterase
MTVALTFSEQGAHRLLRSVMAMPAELLARTGGPPARNDRGDLLDPEARVLCAFERLIARDRRTLTPAQARLDLRRYIRIAEGHRGSPRLLARTEDFLVLGHHVRLYVPRRRAGPPPPVLVYLHGGGWVVGDLHTHDRFCRRLAADGAQLVVSVDYPLAPEHPYPRAAQVCREIFSWVRDHAASLGGDPARVAIGGDSAGGNLAAAVCLRLRDAGEPQPTFQLLVYPALDLRCTGESYHKLGQGYLLDQDAIQWYLRHYGASPDDPRASPLLEPDLAGLAPALVVTAGFDPLRDDGERYVQRLGEAGGEATLLPYPSLVHGFIHFDGAVHAADRAIVHLAREVHDRWQRRPLGG